MVKQNELNRLSFGRASSRVIANKIECIEGEIFLMLLLDIRTSSLRKEQTMLIVVLPDFIFRLNQICN